MRKSFLVLFFKKEHSSFPPAMPGTYRTPAAITRRMAKLVRIRATPGSRAN